MDVLNELMQYLLAFLDYLMPESPFLEWLVITDDLTLGLSWLNWVMPLRDMLTIMTAWIGICFTITVARVFIRDGGSVARLVIRGAG